jgi:hypothetical protein
VGDIASGNGTGGIGGNGNDRQRLTEQGKELHLVSGSFPVDVYHRPDVVRLQVLLGQVFRQDYPIKLPDHLNLFSDGYAVTRRGRAWPVSANHTARTPGLRPSGCFAQDFEQSCKGQGCFAIRVETAHLLASRKLRRTAGGI